MATYKEIKGTDIQVVSSDPANPTVGQIWYNTTSQSLKGQELATAAWASGGDLNTARREMGGAGTQTAGLVFGGFPPTNATEEYDGSTWTAGGNLGTTRHKLAGAGTQTAGLAFGGEAPPETTATEEYDGSSWTAGGALGTARDYLAGCGVQTAALAIGGTPPVAEFLTEEYDGSTWTAGPNANLFSDNLNAFNGGIGTQTSAMFSGGAGTGTVIYDGTTFATSASIAAARGDLSAAGNAPASAGIVYCGSPVPSVGNTTEEFTGETVAATASTLTTS